MAEWIAIPMVYDNGPAGDDDWMIAEKDGGGIAWGLDKADALHIVGLHNAALSHAAGQEAVAWVAKDDPMFRDDWSATTPLLYRQEKSGFAPQGLVPLYLTPAATTNPAEIGRKSVGAGQEAEYASTGIWQSRVFDEEADPPCWSEWWTVRNRIEDEMAAASSQPTPTDFRELFVQVTPAQPPASAEVGRDAEYRILCSGEVMRETDEFVTDDGKWSNVRPPFTGMRYMNHMRTVRRVAASSGRKESPIAGVTHGTDEGWGDE